MEIDRDTAREHFRILCQGLYEFAPTGGNLHVLIDDENTDDSVVNWLNNFLHERREVTYDAQWALERAILDLFMKFNEKDRGFILRGYDI